MYMYFLILARAISDLGSGAACKHLVYVSLVLYTFIAGICELYMSALLKEVCGLLV